MADEPGRPDAIRAVPVRRPGRWVAGAFVLLVAVAIVQSAATNPRFHWDVVGHYLFNGSVTAGVRVTIELTVVSMLIGIALGIVLAIMRLSENPLVKGFSSFYVGFLRGTPVLVQILFWFFVSALYPKITLGLPFGGPALIHANANHLISPFRAAVLGLALNEAAYMAEIVRAGMLSVDEGQGDAAAALGMTRLQSMRRIVLPQAMRVIIPPTGNETISMLKTTSLVSVIGYKELLYSTQLIYSVNYRQIPLLLVACIWYLLMTTVLSIGQHFLERHYGRGTARATGAGPGLGTRIRANLAVRQRSRGGTEGVT